MTTRRLKVLLVTLTGVLLIKSLAAQTAAAPAASDFSRGLSAYRSGDYPQATQVFRELNLREPSSGALQNLGNAEWQRGRTGAAILAWEQSLWLNPFDPRARNNLRFARENAQLETPVLRWYEIAASWLPASCWAWLVAGSLWIAIGALVFPGVFRWRRAAWQQAVAAFSFGVFLLCIPAQVGTLTRTNLGFVLQKETPLRLTPTSGADLVTRLAAGEPARKIRARGNYLFIRTHHSAGWVLKEQFGLICARSTP